MKVVVERKIAHKIVAYAADNTNLNFGGSKRNGVNNVWRRLQTELDRQVFGINFESWLLSFSSISEFTR